MENIIPFETALSVLKAGGRVSRSADAKGSYYEVQMPDEGSKNTEPYIYKVLSGSIAEDGTTEAAKRFPWQPTPYALFANDWILIEDPRAQVAGNAEEVKTDVQETQDTNSNI